MQTAGCRRPVGKTPHDRGAHVPRQPLGASTRSLGSSGHEPGHDKVQRIEMPASRGGPCSPGRPFQMHFVGVGGVKAPGTTRPVTGRPSGGGRGLCPGPCSRLGSRAAGRARPVLFGSLFQAPLAQPRPARPSLSSRLSLASPGPALSSRERMQATVVLPNAPRPCS